MTTARRAGTVSATALTGVSLALALAHSVAPSWARRAGLDLWNLPSLRQLARECDEEAVVAQQKRDRLMWEIEASEHAAARLVDGTLTLAGAVEELSPWLEVRSGFETGARNRFRTTTLRQSVARYAIDKARVILADEPARWAVVSARLEAEYAALK